MPIPRIIEIKTEIPPICPCNSISQLLKKKNQIEIDLFYENSLGHLNKEKVQMQLLGIRTAYSISVK